jgi:hypothetical protein
LLTQSFIKEVFDYQEDGSLVWKVRPEEHFNSRRGQSVFNTLFAGRVAGSLDKENRMATSLTQYGNLYLHRLVFLYHRGYLPDIVDHIDRDTTNNRIENLREVNCQQNLSNRSLSKGNKSGHTGVYKTKSGKYLVQLMYKSEIKKIGLFEDYEEACEAYRQKSKELRGELCPFS